MTIYQRIQELAKRKNISIRELENRLGFSNGTLNKWRDSAPSEKLTKVAKYLNTTVDYLVLGSGPISSLGEAVKTQIDLDDPDIAMSFEGRPISDEDLEIFKRLLRGDRN